MVLAVLNDVVSRAPELFSFREVPATRPGEHRYALDRAGESELGLVLSISRRYHAEGEVLQRKTVEGKPKLSSFEAIWGPSCTPERLLHWVCELEDAEPVSWARG